MKLLHHGKKVYGPVAENYNELNGKQLRTIAALLVNGQDALVNSLKALKVLLKINLFRFFLIPTDAKKEMLTHIGWVFEKNQLTKQLIGYYGGRYGPAGDFENMKMGEWNACEIFYRQIVKDKNDEALDLLVTTLYRKPKTFYNVKRNKDGDIRVAFNMNELEYNNRQVKHWPADIKLSVLMWYDGCREMLKDTYDLFNGTGDGPEQDDMFEVISSLCGERFGPFKEVEQLNVLTALRDIEATKRQAEEMERKLKSSPK